MMSKILKFDTIKVIFLINENNSKSPHAPKYSPKSVQNAKTGNLKISDHPVGAI